MATKLSTEAYKGTRDFYPEDMAVQRYIFDTWAKAAESFGFARYDASILEPAELYRSKTSEEIVNEQTYTFIDRGDREVTLRPEMTPTVARMVAGKRRDLQFPLRWYSIPNLFRYERPQRGRLREHWQLNCDMFGTSSIASDVEMIALAANVLTSFGATPKMFEIRINDRKWLNELFENEKFNPEQSAAMLALLDRKEKITNFDAEAKKIAGKKFTLPKALGAESHLAQVIAGLKELGITNVVFSPSTVRGFTYYTGTIFEIFDTSKDNNRSMLGGGRYDNLTGLFGGEPISGIGFGMGDVVMRDFLETHNLLKGKVLSTAPVVILIPETETQHISALKVAQQFRNAGIKIAVDTSDRKSDKKKSSAEKLGATYILTFTETSGVFTLRTLTSKVPDVTGTVKELLTHIS